MRSPSHRQARAATTPQGRPTPGWGEGGAPLGQTGGGARRPPLPRGGHAERATAPRRRRAGTGERRRVASARGGPPPAWAPAGPLNISRAPTRRAGATRLDGGRVGGRRAPPRRARIARSMEAVGVVCGAPVGRRSATRRGTDVVTNGLGGHSGRVDAVGVDAVGVGGVGAGAAGAGAVGAERSGLEWSMLEQSVLEQLVLEQSALERLLRRGHPTSLRVPARTASTCTRHGRRSMVQSGAEGGTAPKQKLGTEDSRLRQPTTACHLCRKPKVRRRGETQPRHSNAGTRISQHEKKQRSGYAQQ